MSESKEASPRVRAANNGAPGIEIRKARSGEAAQLTRIAFAAKRHWSYPEAWIRLWTKELTVNDAYLESNEVFAACAGSTILGWCAISTHNNECFIDHCWVLPKATKKGVGRALIEKSLHVAREMRVNSLRVISDPNAEGFYRKFGFRKIGMQPSVPNDRKLPVMKITLAAQ